MIQHIFSTNFISPDEKYLSTLENYPKSSLSEGKWLMQRHQTRSHIRFDFDISEPFNCVECDFINDSPFDIFINGIKIDTHKEGQGISSYHVTGLCDITGLCKEGTNRVGICSYGSDTPEKFTHALRGCIRVTDNDGIFTDYTTDESWKSYLVCKFNEGTQPENWFVSETPGRPTILNSFETHPRLRRRSVILAKDFDVKKPIHSATLFATARGLYVPFINDFRITDARFLPGVGDNAVEFRRFDITKDLKQGTNTISAMLGNGWLNGGSWGDFFETTIPSLAMQLEIEYIDGEIEKIITDETWKLLPSPILDNDLQNGERYDARLEISASDIINHGVNAVVVDSSSFPKIQEQIYPPVRICKELPALSYFPLPDGKHICYDFGTNAAGRAKITLHNTKAGQRIFIRYCELLKQDGTPNMGSFTDVYFPQDCQHGAIAEYGARNLDVYICKGAKIEEYIPEFSYTGFRYIYITGLDDSAYKSDTVKKLEMNTDLAEVGDFETSNADMSQIWDAVKRSYRSNIFNGPTDCPTREKNFWNGDIQVFANTACWYMDNYEFLSAWTKTGRKMQPDVYGWEDEEYILPLILYKYYGNKTIIEEKYPVVQKLIEKRLSQLKAGESLPKDHSPYCDHQAVVNVPPEFFAGCYFCLMYRESAKMAHVLGKYDDETRYHSRFEELRNEFNQNFYLASEYDYSPRCQGAIVLACAFGIADKENIPFLVEKLHKYVAENDYHITSGFMSTEHILGLLCEYGYHEDAWKIISNKQAPSLLHMLSTHGGATTTEHWRGAESPNHSMNHYAIGCMSKWFFEQAGGLTITKAGFDKITFNPYMNKELKDCKIVHNSRHGKIISAWEYNTDSDTFAWNITIPNGIEAHVVLPKGFEFVQGQTCIIEKGGTYSFVVREKAVLL